MGFIAFALLAFGVLTSPSLAQAPPKIFLASTGADGNDGSRVSPKRSLQAAHDAVAAGGEIVILDSAGYGIVTIRKSVGVVVPPGVSAFVTSLEPYATAITINAGASDVVTLRGLIVEGPGPDVVSNGIYARTFGTLVIEDTIVRNLLEGIYVKSPVASRLVVRGGAVRNVAYGIDVEADYQNGNVNAIVTDTELTRNGYAFYASAAPTTSAVRVTVSRCAASGNDVLVFAAARTAFVFDGCVMAGNDTLFTAAAAGVNYTVNNNTIYNNTSLGKAPTPLPPQ